MEDIFLTKNIPDGIKEFLLDKEAPLSVNDIYLFFLNLEWKIVDIVNFISHIENNYPKVIRNIETYLADDLFRVAIVPINLQEMTKIRDVIKSLSRVLSYKESKDLIIEVLSKNNREADIDDFYYILDNYDKCSLKIFEVFNTDKIIAEKEHLKLN